VKLEQAASCNAVAAVGGGGIRPVGRIRTVQFMIEVRNLTKRCGADVGGR
jgi:hypothetical protein